MPTRKTHDLCVVVGTYEKDGQTKNKYKNIGSGMVNDDGDGVNKFLLLDRTFNPAGVPNPKNSESVLINFFEIKDKEAF